MNYLKDILKGMVLGVSNVIPGVSAGTMAVVMNIYERILNSISLRGLKENLGFLMSIGIGALAGILLFSRVVLGLLAEFPVATNFVFIGLIFGSVPMIYRLAKFDKIKSKNLIPFFIALGIMITISIFNNSIAGASFNSVDALAVDGEALAVFWWLFVASAIASFMMILPGISGSFIMLVLGVYSTVMTGVANLDLTILTPVALGVIVGIIFGAKIIKELIHSHPQATYMAILGLVVGSIFALFPADFALNIEGVVAIILGLIALVFSYKLGNI